MDKVGTMEHDDNSMVPLPFINADGDKLLEGLILS